MRRISGAGSTGRPVATTKRDVILAALFMVLANRYDWQLFLEVTGPGGSGKSILAEIATLLAGEDNATSADIDTLEDPRKRASLIGFSLIRLPDQEKWSGDGAGLKAITGGDAVSVDPKYQNPYSTHIPAVILAVNNNPMRFTDRSGGVSRRRVIIHFPEQIAPEERDPQLRDKIARAGRDCAPAYAEVQRPDDRAHTAPVAAELRRGAQHQARC
jgi:putative DNA primase/helicase